jgi:hypothetical protein
MNEGGTTMAGVSSEGGQLLPFTQQIFQGIGNMPAKSADAQKGLVSLEQVTLQVVDKGFVTQADVQKLKDTASVLMPYLDPPRQELLTKFMNEVTSAGGGKIPLTGPSGKNAFLNCSAILLLFILDSKVISIESKIQLAENLYKSKLGLAMLATAMSQYAATIAKGLIEASQYKAQAVKASIDASCALASIMTTVGLFMAQKAMENMAETQMRKDLNAYPETAIPDNKPLSVDQRSTITRQVDMQMQPLKGTTDGVIQMIKSTAEASMDYKLAELAVQSAQQQATADLLNKVADLLSQSAQMLAKSADTDIAQTIQSQLELLATAIRAYGEIGSR